VLPGNNKVDLSLNSPRKKSVTRYQFNKPLTKQQLTTVKPHHSSLEPIPLKPFR